MIIGYPTGVLMISHVQEKIRAFAVGNIIDSKKEEAKGGQGREQNTRGCRWLHTVCWVFYGDSDSFFIPQRYGSLAEPSDDVRSNISLLAEDKACSLRSQAKTLC